MGMPTQQSSKSSPRGRATARRDKKTRRKEGRAAKRKVVESRDEYGGKGSDDEGEPEKKKKKKKKQKLGPDGEAVPQKLTARGLKPKMWESEKLPPFRRDVRCPQGLDEPPLNEAATEELRKFLRLRVPEQRTRVCRFWQQGSCSRGDACGFAHSLAADAAPAARCPPPVQSLADPVLPKLTGRAMLHLGHHRPTPVQAQAWPAALAGHDLLCRAPTGTGKTLAYLLPAMAHAEAQRKGRPGDGPSVLVLVPTRELAMQVSAAADQLRKLTGWAPAPPSCAAVTPRGPPALPPFRLHVASPAPGALSRVAGCARSRSTVARRATSSVRPWRARWPSPCALPGGCSTCS